MGPGRARAEALRILLRVGEGGAWASRLLESLDEQKLDPRDLALVHEIVLGVLRWRGFLDRRLRALCSRPIDRLDPPVREALRMAAYQVIFLDRVPSHAAVNESVSLVRRGVGRSAAGFVNAVLRRLAKEKESRPEERPGLGAERTPRALAAALSHPEWLVRRALERFGPEEGRSLLLANNAQAPVTLRPNPLHDAHAGLAARLEAEGVRTTEGDLAPGALRLDSGNPVRTGLFREGAFWIQDEASQMVPLLFPPPWDGLTADLCAAPGGKTFVLATGARGRVVAFDIHIHRCARLLAGVRRVIPARRTGSGVDPGREVQDYVTESTVAESSHALDRPTEWKAAGVGEVAGIAAESGNLRNKNIGSRSAGSDTARRPAGADRTTGCSMEAGRVAVVVGDLADAPPIADGAFDRVLVDAPCSGTGVLRRHPEIRWRLTPGHLQELASLQGRLLDTAWRAAKPGGWIVYSVCSLEPEEGEQVVAAFAARSGCRVVDPRAHLPERARRVVGDDGFLRTFPHRHGTDGFFAALMRKPAAIG
jgi:16S rRNA C967 or C1407 C5-methylase (RsmB/RsmF family)